LAAVLSKVQAMFFDSWVNNDMMNAGAHTEFFNGEGQPEPEAINILHLNLKIML
jgi:hypothetical protein